MAKSYLLKVSKIVKETSHAVSIFFEIPTNIASEFTFTSGQYLTIETIIGGKNIRRSYSISSTPHSGEISVVIKEVKEGAFSVYANNQLKVGDELTVFPPEGRFVFLPKPEAVNHYSAFAAGSGIIPVMSIIQTALEKEPQSTFLLVYGNKSPKDTIFLNPLKELKSNYPSRFFIEFVYSQTIEDEAQFGRIDESIINYFLKNKYGHLTFDSYFLCGPEVMIQTVTQLLKDKEVSESAIYFELFTTSDSTAAVVEMATDGFTTLTVTLDDEITTLMMPQSKAVLDAALDEGLDPPYSCHGGICSTCIARITEGKAEMRKNQILTDSEVAEGLILTCQAHPVTAVLKVDYDDV